MFKAYCPNCGNVFPSSIFAGSANITGLTLQGNREQCPRCGHMANVEDGVFDIVNGVLTRLREANIPSDELLEFSRLVVAAKEKSEEPDDLLKQADEINPEIGKVIKSVESGKTARFGAVLLLVAACLTHCSGKLDASVDLNKLLDQVVAISNMTSPMVEKANVILPEVGPIPPKRPQNRHERRKSKKQDKKQSS